MAIKAGIGSNPRGFWIPKNAMSGVSQLNIPKEKLYDLGANNIPRPVDFWVEMGVQIPRSWAVFYMIYVPEVVVRAFVNGQRFVP